MKFKNVHILAIISLGTLFISFFLRFDISGGGASSDIATHWRYIQILNKDINNLFFLKAGEDYRLLHFPLHHLIFSRFDFISNSIETYYLIFFIFSLILPIVFYLNCKLLYNQINDGRLIILSLIVILFPHYQASAIWGNSHITALIFFLSSLLCLNYSNFKFKFLKKKYIFLSIVFMSLASYTRQYYVIFFPYLILNILLHNKFKNLLFLSTILITLSIPGIYYLINNPKLFYGLKMEVTDFKSSILVVFSIVSFYLIPFFLIDLRKNLSNLKNIFSGKVLYLFIISCLILFYLCLNFKYESSIGGGIFYKTSLLIGNNLIFFLSSYIGLILIIYFTKFRIDNVLLIILIVFSFSSGIYIFQKYFEPLIYFILLFILIDKKYIILIKNFNFLISYFIAYWIVYFLYAKILITMF